MHQFYKSALLVKSKAIKLILILIAIIKKAVFHNKRTKQTNNLVTKMSMYYVLCIIPGGPTALW